MHVLRLTPAARSDVLFLDLALEGAGRRAIEAALPALRAEAAEAASGGEGAGARLRALMLVAAACLEGVCLTAPGHREGRLCLTGVQVSNRPSCRLCCRCSTRWASPLDCSNGKCPD